MMPDHPIVILGMPRSGTTLLRRLLNAHGRIYCPGETFQLRAVARYMKSESVADGIDYGVAGGLSAIGGNLELLHRLLRETCFSTLQPLAQSRGKERIAIKTAVDVFHVDGFRPVFDGHVKYICLFRHGLDVVISLQEFCSVMKCYIEELMPYISRYRRPMVAFAVAWAEQCEALYRLCDELRDDSMGVRYEDLVENPDDTLAEIFDFLGERMPPDVVKKAFEASEVDGLGDYKSFSNTRIVDDSLRRWESMDELTLLELCAHVNGMLAKLGYEEIDVPQRYRHTIRTHEISMIYKNATRWKDK